MVRSWRYVSRAFVLIITLGLFSIDLETGIARLLCNEAEGQRVNFAMVHGDGQLLKNLPEYLFKQKLVLLLSLRITPTLLLACYPRFQWHHLLYGRLTPPCEADRRGRLCI